MGLTVQNNNIVMKDGLGNVRFSTDRAMPHLLHVVSGSFTIPDVSGTANFTLANTESGSYYNFSGLSVSQSTTHTAVNNPNVIAGSDAFITPFISISGGIFATPAGQVMSALGSSVVHLFIRNDGYFAGSTILNVLAEGNQVNLTVKSEISTTSNHTIQNHSVSYNTPSGSAGSPSTATAPATVSGTGFTVSYKIYYGRFN